MERCPRCLKVVEANWAYCPVCSRPRILESLQSAIVPPTWQHQVWRGLVATVSVWLLVTLGVAFLREAKAVRVSRTLLGEGKVQESWLVLQPFLPGHPKHRQGQFLCGKETIRLGLKAEAQQCLHRLDELSPELAKELRADYGPILTEQTRRLSCEPGKFEELLSWGDQLGETFATNVIAGLDGVVDSCHGIQNDGELANIAKVLTKRGKAMAMVERGYVPAIGRAAAEARYQDAEGLARLAVRQIPEAKEPVAAALKDERQKVTVTMQTLRRLNEAIKGDESFRLGYYPCFPPAAPAPVQSARDGWGNAVQYKPLGDSYALGERTDCYQGFEVVSNRTSEVELTCSFTNYWGDRCNLPGRFWWGSES